MEWLFKTWWGTLLFAAAWMQFFAIIAAAILSAASRPRLAGAVWSGSLAICCVALACFALQERSPNIVLIGLAAIGTIVFGLLALTGPPLVMKPATKSET